MMKKHKMQILRNYVWDGDTFLLRETFFSVIIYVVNGGWACPPRPDPQLVCLSNNKKGRRGVKYMAEKKFQANDIIKALEDVFKKAPHLSKKAQEVLVKITPILALVFGILGILVGLGAVGVSPVVLLGGVDASFLVLASGVAAIASSVFMLVAYPKLNKRQYGGWTLLFWSEVISAASALLSLSVGAIIGVIIGFYLLFEIKGHYK